MSLVEWGPSGPDLVTSASSRRPGGTKTVREYAALVVGGPWIGQHWSITSPARLFARKLFPTRAYRTPDVQGAP